MAYYIKVRENVAEDMGLKKIRNKTADGGYLLWQADLNGVSGKTIFDRASAIGGICLLPEDARKEMDGSKINPFPDNESVQTSVEETDNTEDV